MATKYLMALDGGTGSFRAILFDLEANQIGVSQEEWDHVVDPSIEGSMGFDYDSNWKIIVRCIKNAITENEINPEDIIGISTSSMREGAVFYDENYNELIGFSNIDSRSNEETIELKEKYPNLESELFQYSGESYALSTIPRIMWVKNHEPEIYKKIVYMNMINDWISFKLTGKLVSEPSNSSTTGVFNIHTREWDQNILERLGIKEIKFPEVIEPSGYIGNISEDTSELTNLSTKTKVIMGGGDAQAGCIGVGSVKKNQAALFGGSFWQYEYNLDKLPETLNKNIRVNCHSMPAMWQYELIAWNPGLSMRWFRDGFCQSETELAKENNTSAYTLLDEKAKEIPAGSNGVLALFSNIMDFSQIKHAAPTFTNFSLDSDKYNKYTFYKAIMESAAMVSLGHQDILNNVVDKKIDEITFAGGASKSPIWCQIVSDVLGIPVKVPKEKEATALGVALLTGVGVQAYKNIEEAIKLIKWDKTYYPIIENNKIYKEHFKKWKAVYAKQQELSDDGYTTSMWRGAGV